MEGKGFICFKTYFVNTLSSLPLLCHVLAQDAIAHTASCCLYPLPWASPLPSPCAPPGKGLCLARLCVLGGWHTLHQILQKLLWSLKFYG